MAAEEATGEQALDFLDSILAKIQLDRQGTANVVQAVGIIRRDLVAGREQRAIAKVDKPAAPAKDYTPTPTPHRKNPKDTPKKKHPPG